jgi:hypothetical protein
MPERGPGYHVNFNNKGIETRMGDSGKNRFSPAMRLEEAVECASSLSIYFGEPTIEPIGLVVWTHTTEEVRKQQETNVFSTVINVR